MVVGSHLIGSDVMKVGDQVKVPGYTGTVHQIIVGKDGEPAHVVVSTCDGLVGVPVSAVAAATETKEDSDGQQVQGEGGK